MSLKDIEPNASLERRHHHTLSFEVLEKLDEAEAFFIHGNKLLLLLNDQETKRGWQLVLKAARLGLPLALAQCFYSGQGVAVDRNRAVELVRASARRGHPIGTRSLAAARVIFVFSSFRCAFV